MRDISPTPLGLNHRYNVEKVNDPTGKHDACRYFVLDPQHDPIARAALVTYASAARAAGYHELYRDLMDWVDLIENGQAPSAVLRESVKPEGA